MSSMSASGVRGLPSSFVGMAVISASTLLLQVALTRVFSVAQFYHFAFLVVSLVLLGFGASGSLLALFPRLRSPAFTAFYAAGFGVTSLASYLFINHNAFDSYSIAWDVTQVYLLIANLLALTVPFVFAGALIGAVLSNSAERAGSVYAANLIGSALGSVAAPLFIGGLGSERTVLLCAALGSLSGLFFSGAGRRVPALVSALVGVLSFILLFIYLPAFEVRPSPYKALSQFRLNPDAEITATMQNAYSRLDVVESSTIHSAQGLSLSYFGDLPPQVGLLTDGSNLQPVSDAARTDEDLLQALPVTVAYRMKQKPDALVLGAGGNMAALAALANGAASVTVVEPNELVYDALRGNLAGWAGLATHPQVTLVRDEVRSFVRSAPAAYDLVELSLVENYRPITSGAFTLTEDYTLTVEAFDTYLNALEDDGLLVVHRWLQTPPSECLRTLALIVTALGDRDPLQHIVAFRSFQHVTFIVKPTPFTDDETDRLLEGIADLNYDLVIAPEMPEAMLNQYAVLAEDIYHDLFLDLIQSSDRQAFYASYDFEIAPPTDDRPFFFHFFRWEQTPAVIENLGRRWQPFGGSGYFVLLALLAFALVTALVFVLAPMALQRRFRQALTAFGTGRSLRTLAYFVLIGLAFLLVEVALIQQYMLLLGHPTLAIATIVGALLLFSGIGSAVSPHVSWRVAILALVMLLIVYPVFVDAVSPALLPLAQPLRALATALLIAPVGFLMGMPFPRGILTLSQSPDLVPWAWAANGSASVVSAVLAATLSLSLGFTAVLLVGGGLYLLAALTHSRV